MDGRVERTKKFISIFIQIIMSRYPSRNIHYSNLLVLRSYDKMCAFNKMRTKRSSLNDGIAIPHGRKASVRTKNLLANVRGIHVFCLESFFFLRNFRLFLSHCGFIIVMYDNDSVHRNDIDSGSHVECSGCAVLDRLCVWLLTTWHFRQYSNAPNSLANDAIRLSNSTSVVVNFVTTWNSQFIADSCRGITNKFS